MNFFEKMAKIMSGSITSSSGSSSSSIDSPSYNNTRGLSTSNTQSMNRPTQTASDKTIYKSEVNSDMQRIKKDWTVLKPTQNYNSRTKTNSLSNLVDKRFGNQRRTSGSRGMAMI